MFLQHKGIYLGESPGIDLTTSLYFETGSDVLLIKTCVECGMESKARVQGRTRRRDRSDVRDKERDL